MGSKSGEIGSCRHSVCMYVYEDGVRLLRFTHRKRLGHFTGRND